MLSELTLEHLYDRPLTDDQGRVDSVMRVNYDIDRDVFASIAPLTFGELKDRLLSASGDEIARIGRPSDRRDGGRGREAVRRARVDSCRPQGRAIPRGRERCSGAPARSRRDCSRTIRPTIRRGSRCCVIWGLALGAGDAIIGVNPAVDTVENVERLLRLLDSLRRRFDVPTQICVLAHIKTQLACLERGAPVEILFQSLAGTETTNLREFDISVDLLDHGYRTMAAKGPLRDAAEQFMYFETGQGSEFSYGTHHGIDMTTTEALCYGLARRYDPFMVNNVTGFIGPETHLDSFEMMLGNLQDHFMGKLLGLPMGMAPCYTLHSRTILEGQQIATQLLTAARGELLHGRVPQHGPHAGLFRHERARRAIASRNLRPHAGARIRRVGHRPRHLSCDRPTATSFAEPSGAIRDSSAKAKPNFSELMPPHARALRFGNGRPAACQCRHAANANQPGHGPGRHPGGAESRPIAKNRRISAYSRPKPPTKRPTSTRRRPVPGSRPRAVQLAPERRQVQIVVSDGLSALAVEQNLPDLLPVLLDGLKGRGRSAMGQPIAVAIRPSQAGRTDRRAARA